LARLDERRERGAQTHLIEGNNAEGHVLLAEGSQLNRELIERRDYACRGIDDLGCYVVETKH
jgi:hypothetical protein